MSASKAGEDTTDAPNFADLGIDVRPGVVTSPFGKVLYFLMFCINRQAYLVAPHFV